MVFFLLFLRWHGGFVPVYRWWRGERTPRQHYFLAYAELVDRPANWFYRDTAANSASEPAKTVGRVEGDWRQLLVAHEIGIMFAVRPGNQTGYGKR
jgi:hypothetical protein